MAFIDDLLQCDLNWEKGENLKKALLLKVDSYSVTNEKRERKHTQPNQTQIIKRACALSDETSLLYK